MALDTAALTQLIVAVGGLITILGGIQLRRDAQARRERAADRRELGYVRRLLRKALAHITRQDWLLASRGLNGPAMDPELEELYAGEYPDHDPDDAGPADPEPRTGRAAHRRAT